VVEDLIEDVFRERRPARTLPPPDREVSPPRPPAGAVSGTGHRGRREDDD
jgi:hypothetical protein